MDESHDTELLLLPSFEKAYWRSVSRIRYRDHSNFSKKKRHFEPEDHNAFATRWAEELTAEENAAEVKQIYENTVTILGNRRSQMEKGDQSLDCEQFRFTIAPVQDPEDPRQIMIVRCLWIKIPLHSLPAHFDDIFPFRPDEIVVPITAHSNSREILALLEFWESKLNGRLQESADQTQIRLNLKSGFSMGVDLRNQETSFSKVGVEGPGSLSAAIATDLKSLGIMKSLGGES